MNLRIAALVSTMAAACLLGACATTPQANFYTLNGIDPDKTDARFPLVVAIGPIDLPQYLDRPHIVTRVGGNRLNVDEFNRWAGALEEDITRVLARRIGGRLGTQRIYSYPSRVVPDTDYRIALDIRAFDGALDGEVHLDVSWSVIADRSGEVLQTHQASYQGVSAGGGYEAYAAALSEMLARLGDDLATALGKLASAGDAGKIR
jgi:uncharacterized lipoprotein YmbA